MNTMTDEVSPDFSGKVVWLEIAGAPETRGGVLLEYVEFRKYCGRVFLVGRMAEWDVSGWLAGTDAAVAWDSVVHYLVFKSREDYQKRATTHKPSLRDRVFGG
jgi:hypothetical protein